MSTSPRLLINGWFWGQTTTGSGQYLQGLLQHLPAALPDWQIILLRPHQAPPGLPLPETKLPLPAGIREQYAPWPRLARGPRLIKLLWEQITVPLWFRKLQANVLWTPYWGSPLFVAGPSVVTIHDLIPLLLPDYASKPTARAYTWLVGRSARSSAAILTVSQSAANDIQRHLHIPASRIHVTYEALGYPHAPVHDSELLTRVRQRYQLPPHYLLYLGGFDPRKNVPLLLRAYRRACDENPTLPPLLLAGKLPPTNDSWFTDPRPIIDKLGLQEKVRPLGFVDDADKPALYTLADLFIFPSRYEGFGLPPLEALTCATPALVSDSSSLPEVVGNTLPPVPVDDVESLAQAILQALHHPPDPQKLLAQAARFNWQKTASHTADVLRAQLLA
ncbi:MAG: glycosyltransferase family 4 protein [Chloroflexi bacterium]|nr:glycosyltransferase family 4 protein [Chloroflexota bacterium]